MLSQKYAVMFMALIGFVCININAMHKPIEEKDIFDKNTWDGKQKEFSHYRNSNDNIVRPVNGAGVLPVVCKDSTLYFLLSVAVVENGTDENIGNDLVYVNQSNYPKSLNPDELYELSVDMAARPEELGIISSKLNYDTIKFAIEKNGFLLPNAGMWFGKYGVPTYIIFLGDFEQINPLLKDVEQKIEQEDYESIFPTASSTKRSDKIKKFELVPAYTLLQAIKDQGNNIIQRPLAIEGCEYKLSPYLARTIALNNSTQTNTPVVNNMLVIEKALQEYESLAS